MECRIIKKIPGQRWKVGDVISPSNEYAKKLVKGGYIECDGIAAPPVKKKKAAKKVETIEVSENTPEIDNSNN